MEAAYWAAIEEEQQRAMQRQLAAIEQVGGLQGILMGVHNSQYFA